MLVACFKRCYMIVNQLVILFLNYEVFTPEIGRDETLRNRKMMPPPYGRGHHRVLLLHTLETLPANIPPAIVGKAGVEGLGTAIPASTHHGDGGEQGAVAWQIDAQTIGGLEIMAVDEIGILLRIDEQGVEGGLRIAETGGCHGNHAIVPAPSGGPIPMLHHPLERGLHLRLIV